jgi:hypothetical protein
MLKNSDRFAISNILLLREGRILVGEVVPRRWEHSRIRRFEVMVRDIQPLTVDPRVQASALCQHFSMCYAVVTISAGDVDQLP